MPVQERDRILNYLPFAAILIAVAPLTPNYGGESKSRSASLEAMSLEASERDYLNGDGLHAISSSHCSVPG
ncbi:hypothetical protein NBRC116598_41500 [Pseudophaeobacter arcticus]|uniref:Uncharacterized protein n=1 Tax=Pseudophaeobacter arcticus TaxID=385492 RepID=A0ABQ0AS77_9RHOB